jgi:hypothetical protein
MRQRESSHKEAQKAQKESAKNVFVLFVPLCGISYLCLFVANFAEL